MGGDEEVNINVRCSNGSKFTVRVGLNATVADFKGVLAQSSDIPSDQQRLIYKGRILKDDQTLHSYGLQADHTVHMVRGFAPTTSNPPPTTNNTNITNPPPTPIENIGLGPSLFPNLDLNSLNDNIPTGLFGTGPPNFEQMQQQLTQNPNMMRDLMNTPAIQSLMNNPELVQSMIMNNPQMRQIIDRNPEIGHVINDPSVLRQTLEAARNPELMREMMRNTDRAMSNIESSPEGFNALRRMYENVQEPFLNASETMGHDNASNPFAALLGGGGSQTRDELNSVSETNTGSAMPNSNPLPNPWGGGPQANSTTRPNPIGDAAIRPPPGIAGLGGLGLPELDPSTMGQLLQNPAVSQLMQSMLSNPQYMNQFIGSNPQLQAMLDTNPQLREMMQNPEFLRQLTSPGTMQQVMGIQQSLMQLNTQQSTQGGVRSGGAQGTQNNSGLDMLMNMFSGLGAGGMDVFNSQPDVPPEELYATQLSQLQEMGFFDAPENIRALRATSGNVHAAVERLLGNLGQ